MLNIKIEILLKNNFTEIENWQYYGGEDFKDFINNIKIEAYNKYGQNNINNIKLIIENI